MDPSDALYVADELNMDRDGLLAALADCRRREAGMRSREIENANANAAMYRDYQAVKKERDGLKAENERLKAELVRMTEQNQLLRRKLFGRGTEKLSDLSDASPDEEFEDEAQDEPQDGPGEGSSGAGRKNPEARRYRERHPGKKRTGKRKQDLDRLPQRSRHILDFGKYDREYGEGNWGILAWKVHRTVEVEPRTPYCMNTFTPVIMTGMDEPSVVTVPNPYTLLPGSYVSASLMADILYQRFRSHVPVYRQEQAMMDYGCTVPRQNMTNWILRFAQELFYPLYCLLQVLILGYPYHQCDETPWCVINDGRSPGSRSYFWCHMTSEFCGGNPIILFLFELTRGTDHLRKFYEDFAGFITCDAYCSYQVLGRESLDVITICGCMMHLRRRLAMALAVIDTSKMTEEAAAELPERKALVLIGRVYDADESLKGLSADERRQARQETVKPLLEDYYRFIDGLDEEDPLMSDRLRDAVRYSKNQKEYLSRFLEDGSVPIDNGACERHIRPLTISRGNSLFSTSVDGAEAVAIMYSVVETARANGANVYWYLRYILEEMPKHLEDTDRGFLDDMLPWSDRYREYETARTTGSHPKPPDIFEQEPMKPKIKTRELLPVC